jgi:superfamily II DNA or RNA helicase
VEGHDADHPHNVEVRHNGEGALSFSCPCGVATAHSVCRHVVATLFAYADQQQETDTLLSATDHAIQERMKRGRAEVEVKALGGEPWFGAWQALSISSASPFPRPYQVTIRSLSRRANLCSCPDFAGNQLGTCKHVEAVLHQVQKHPDYQQFKDLPAPLPYVYLDWTVEEAPKVRLHRSPRMVEELQTLTDRYFDQQGTFLGRLPDGFFRFLELCEERGDIHIGDDALAHARHLATAASHSLRSQSIKQQITDSGRIVGVKARLYPYQIEGAAFLAGTGRALLADDMGLGKTLQAISAAVWLTEHEDVKQVLIICPASLKQQWAREIGKFTDMETQIVQGPPPERGAQYRRQCQFHIINYELILRDLTVINETLRPDLIILDEAQRIKNWRTKIAAAVKLIPCRYAFVLTGTPLENRLEDLYSLMQVVDPKVLGPLWRYLVEFHVTDQRGKVLGYRNLSLLRQRLAPVMLRRDRRLVRDQLPDRIEQRLDVEMSPVQRDLHEAAMATAGRIAHIAKKRPLTPSEQHKLMAALQQARMACNAAGLVDKESEGSPKLDELMEILDQLCLQAGLKAVVFSQWERMTRLVEHRLRKMGLGFVRLHGGVPTAQRGELIDRFREEAGVQVFLSTDAGGVGLNLQSASVLVNLDVPWTPAVLEQRNARVHRLGQTRTVQIITMVTPDSYEERVLSLVRGKQHLFDNVISEDATEDVVGVSKRLLETLVDDLNTGPKAKADEQVPAAGPVVEEAQEVAAAVDVRPSSTGVAPSTAVEEAITACIVELQKAFGPRIERIMGAGGGLLAVIDRVDSEADRIAAILSREVPVAVIDQCTLHGLQRLGANSPMTQGQTYFDATTQAPGEKKVSRLTALATEKFKAATLLAEQHCATSAMELLLSALLALASERAGRSTPITPQEAGVWIYTEAVPKGLLDQEEITLITRALALAQAPTLPQGLLAPLLDKVRVVHGL